MAPDCKKAIVAFLSVTAVFGIMYVAYRAKWQGDNADDDDATTGSLRYADPSLEFVAVIFRHGNRAPMFKYKTDPHANAFPEGSGELTKKGKQHMFKKGQFLRRMYNDYISDLYLDSEISIKTTNIRRTHMSAAMVLAGMYPPKSYQKWSNLETVWQPIPIYNDSPDKGLLFNGRGECPSFDYFKQNVLPNILEFDNHNKTDQFLTYLSEKTEQPITKKNFNSLHDLFICQMAEGLQLPEWIKPDHIEMMKSTMNKDHLTHLFGNPRIQNVIIGPLLNEIVLNMELRSNSFNHNITKKMHLYSGHDVSLASVMGFLGNIQSIPNFGASLHFHVYYNETIGHTVKIFYHNRWDNKKGEEILIPNCSDPCIMQDFNKIVKDHFSTKWEEECQNGEIN